MNYYLPAIRLLPIYSLLVRKLNSTSYDGGLSAKWTAGDIFRIAYRSKIKYQFHINELRITRFNLNQLCAQPAMLQRRVPLVDTPRAGFLIIWKGVEFSISAEPVDIYWFPNTGINFNKNLAHLNMGWWPSEIIVGISWKDT